MAVVEQDRHALQQYLAGKIDTCPQLDFEAASALEAENVQQAAKLIGKDQGTKSAKKESSKRKHALLQEPSISVPSEDTLMLQSIRSDEYCLYNRLTVLNAVGTVSFCYLSLMRLMLVSLTNPFFLKGLRHCVKVIQ